MGNLDFKTEKSFSKNHSQECLGRQQLTWYSPDSNWKEQKTNRVTDLMPPPFLCICNGQVFSLKDHMLLSSFLKLPPNN